MRWHSEFPLRCMSKFLRFSFNSSSAVAVAIGTLLLFEVRHHFLCKQPHRAFGIGLADHSEIHLKRRRFEAAYLSIIGANSLADIIRGTNPGAAFCDLRFEGKRSVVLHCANVSIAKLFGEAGELQRLAPVLRRAFKRGPHGRKKLYAELHGLPDRLLPDRNHRSARKRNPNRTAATGRIEMRIGLTPPRTSQFPDTSDLPCAGLAGCFN